MPNYVIHDLFSQFLNFWNGVKSKTIDEQIDLWNQEYLKKDHDLLLKMKTNYEEEGYDWRKIAREKIFPFISERLTLMKKSYNSIKTSIVPVYRKAEKILGLDFDVNFIIYVGIGNGAGWATTYRGKRACLFGLENMAELGWVDSDILKGLIAHELGHLIHFEWRERNSLLIESPLSFWQLYEEGFAQRCEHLIMEDNTWHQERASKKWLEWCKTNRKFLVLKFMETITNNQPCNEFFGSWFDIKGYSFTGYYLGHEMIQEWQENYSIKEIALFPLSTIKKKVTETLKKWM